MEKSITIIGADTGLAQVMERVSLVAKKDIPVLIHGESGCGKELIAQIIHERSIRKNQIFRRVNCGAIASELIDSELFGHEKGAFTGSSSMHCGWFEQADKGTLFLDEIGELSAAAQVRLLRVLQDGTFTRVGGELERSTNVRIIAATHRNLPQLIEEKMFREDLYYRLNEFPVVIPPLRERIQDIAALAEYYIKKATDKFGIKPIAISSGDISMLQQYSWPGNVREFTSVINRAVLLGEISGKLEIERALGSFMNIAPNLSIIVEDNSVSDADETLDSVIRNHIIKVVTDCYGRIDGPFGAAKKLGMNPNTLRSKMRKLNIITKRLRP